MIGKMCSALRQKHTQTIVPWDEQRGIPVVLHEHPQLGIVTGAWMGGLRAAVLMQTSGFATIPNALASLVMPCQIPALMFVSERGTLKQLAGRLDDFATSIAALVTDLGDRMDDVVILTMSEFGRTVQENGNRGTDHGHGNAMFLMGSGVKGGKVYGKWPGLEPGNRYENRDLAVTTDFREVFTELVTKHLAAKDTSRIFPGFSSKSALGVIG